MKLWMSRHYMQNLVWSNRESRVDMIVDARLVADYIEYSLDYWTSDEQAARWDSLS